MDGKVSAPYGPTEDREKVLEAIINIFPDAVLDIGDNTISGTFTDLDNLKKMIREQSIRDTARQVLSHSIDPNKPEISVFHLNKQAAFVSKVNFTDGNSTLGDITIAIECDGPEALIIELTGTLEDQKDNKDKEDGQ